MNGEQEALRDFIVTTLTLIITVGLVPIIRWIINHERGSSAQRAEERERLVTVESKQRGLQHQADEGRETMAELRERVEAVEKGERDCREQILAMFGELKQQQALTTAELKHVAAELRKRNGMIPVRLPNRDGQED